MVFAGVLVPLRRRGVDRWCNCGTRVVARLVIMSTADGWDFTVPEDAAELLAELRRHGIEPGERLHVARSVARSARTGRYISRAPKERPHGTEQPRRGLDFIGSIQGGPADLSEKTDAYLARGFGRD